MSHAIRIERFFSLPVHELYGYFIDKRLIERWSAPEGMTLKVPVFDFRVGGQYRFEHHGEAGTFVAVGHFRKIIQNELILSVDDEIRDASGKIVATGLSCSTRFASLGGGSGVVVEQSGFSSDEFARNCERSWNYCFDLLQDLVKDSGPRQFHADPDTDSGQRNL
jgi:uncharacterized protein YndB with AHSA1/START domain